MDLDEIIDGLQKAVDGIEEEREHLTRLKEKVNALITKTEMWFAEHGDEWPERGG